MLLELERRPELSVTLSILSPLIALGLTLVAGMIMFALLGHDPVNAMVVYFIEPLSETWSLHE